MQIKKKKSYNELDLNPELLSLVIQNLFRKKCSYIGLTFQYSNTNMIRFLETVRPSQNTTTDAPTGE